MIKMNNKGQGAIIGIIFLIGIFLFIWAVWLGGFLQDQAEEQISAGTYTGLEAFIVANLNLIIFLGLLLFIVFAIAFGGATG